MLEACALTDPGQVRPSNQDCFRIVDRLGLYMLADGMGGARGGAEASRLAVDAVEASLNRASHRDAAALLAAVEEANDLVRAEASRDANLEGMGTTIVAALETKDNDLAIASVGDSRAYLLHGGTLRLITSDQTWVQEVGRGIGLDDEALRTHPMRHVLTMAIGVAPSVRVLYYAVQLQADDILLLATDGLHGVVNDAEIERTLGGQGSLEEKGQKLIGAAHEAGSPDNVTVVLLRSSHRA